MKKSYLLLSFLISITLVSCSKKSDTAIPEREEKPIEFLPFQKINLNALSGFNKPIKNWKIVENVFVDRKQEKTIIPTSGKGVLLNIPTKEINSNIFTNVEHGDIELELDVMMPVKSNSGIYFMGRYEVQLLDSWGVKDPKHSDIGGLYQRWDDNKNEGEKGFEGKAPKINAAKAPGLWQHFKIIFHAPKFDNSGKKIKNAIFEEVWLNGILLHKNVEVTGPTRAAAFTDEVPIAPLMIQGDHGPVAFKNLQYKLYNNKKVELKDLNLKEFESISKKIPKIDTIVAIRDVSVDSLTSTLISGVNLQRLLVFNGNLAIPNSGDYLFELLLKDAGGILIIDQDTIINMDGDYGIHEPGFGVTSLKEGKVPFTFIYNRSRADQKGFTLKVEGPNIQKYFLNPPASMVLKDWEDPDHIKLHSSNEVIMHRSFIMHNSKKRILCISVSSPQDIHYAYDLEFGSLLQVWYGDFMDVTNMWHSRGGLQIAIPEGVSIFIHGDPDFSFLKNNNSIWPNHIPDNIQFKQIGYTIDELGFPTYSHQMDEAIISSKFVPTNGNRALTRIITTNSPQELWHKIGEGDVIEKLPDGTFAINNRNYFVNFFKNQGLKPTIRSSNGLDELLVKIPKGKQEIKYNIIW